jgi:hypothetical protein
MQRGGTLVMPVAVTAPGVERDAVLHALSASGRSIRRLLQKAGARRGWWPAGRRWQRSYARFARDGGAPVHPDVRDDRRVPQQLCARRACTTRAHDADEPAQIALADAALGWMRIERFPSEPVPADARRGHRAPRARHGSCVTARGGAGTLRLRGEANANAPWAKVFADERGERIHRESISLHDAARAGALGFHVARPGAWDARLRLLTQGTRGGGARHRHAARAARARSSRRAWAPPARRSRVSPLRPSELHDGETQLARSTTLRGRALPQDSALADDVAHLLAQLRALHPRVAAPGRLRPIHGAPHAHQWLDGPGRSRPRRLSIVTASAIPSSTSRPSSRRPTSRIVHAVDVDALNRTFVDAYEDRRGRHSTRAARRLSLAQAAGQGPQGLARATASRRGCEGATRNLRRARCAA